MVTPIEADGHRPGENHAWFDVPPIGKAPLIGDVVEFDEPVGMGVVEYGPGRKLDFHCTAITDGSRSIAIGTVVAFTVTTGHLGRLEAQSVRPLPGVMPPGATLAGTTPVTGRSLSGGRGYRASGGSLSGGDPVGSGSDGSGSGEATPPSGTAVD